MTTRRPFGVVLTGIIQILGSLFVLLFSAVMLFAPTIAGKSSRPRPPLPTGFFYGLGIFYDLFAVLGLLTAIGLFRLKNWARYSTLVFSPFPIVVGLSLAAVLFIALTLPATDPRGQSAVTAVRALMLVIGLCLIAVGTSWLYYFNRAATKLAFAQAVGQTSSSPGVQIAGRRVPLSIAVIAALVLFGCLGVIPGFFFDSPAWMFGFAVKGSAARLIFAVLGLLQLYVGVALLRLNNTGRLVAIALNCLWLINGTIMTLMPSGKLSRLIAEIPRWSQADSPGFAANSSFMLLMMRGVSVLGIVSAAIVLYFLVARRWAFRDGAAAQAAAY